MIHEERNNIMKKPYKKPMIIFESFELTANIAAGCAFIATNSAETMCAVLDPDWGMTIFSDLSVCDMTTGDNLCYDVPTADFSVYIS